METLDDKVVVVTGSTRGIGRAIAEACAAAGAAVMISSSNALAVEETAAALAEKNQRIGGAVCDVRKAADVERLLKDSIDAFGRVDVWINNAGVPQGVIPLDELSEDEANQIIMVNLIGTMNGCRVVLPYFKKNGGTIINITGKGGDGKSSAFTSVYAASKAAVSSLTKSLAEENAGSPVSIHLLSPGMVPTDFYRDLRVGRNLESRAASIPHVLEAIGVPPEAAAKLAVKIAAETPGVRTGLTFSAFKGGRMVRGIARIMKMRITGKIME